MAFSTLEKALALAVGLDIAKPGTSRKAALAAARAIGRGTVAASPVIGRSAASIAAANPISTGVGLGLGALATPPGQALLESAAERGAMDRIRAQQAVDLWVYENITRPAEMGSSIARSGSFQGAVVRKAKKKVSKYNKAVKAGMSAVRASKFSGKKGAISNAKTAFKSVNRVASAVNRGKKVSTKGIRGTIARAARRVLK